MGVTHVRMVVQLRERLRQLIVHVLVLQDILGITVKQLIIVQMVQMVIHAWMVVRRLGQQEIVDVTVQVFILETIVR